MYNISINNLFPDCTVNNRPLDVNSLYTIKPKVEEFSVKALIKEREIKQQKIYDEYRKQYRICLAKIKAANKHNITNITFEVPPTIYRCPGYSASECVDYIKIKLDELFFDTDIEETGIINIDWYRLEEKMKAKSNH